MFCVVTLVQCVLRILCATWLFFDQVLIGRIGNTTDPFNAKMWPDEHPNRIWFKRSVALSGMNSRRRSD